MFDVTLKNLGVSIPKVGGAGSFGGGLALDGTLSAENPDSKVTLNVDGDLNVSILAKAKNISELNINVCNGNVNIDCALTGANTFCKIPKINISSCGFIDITDTAKVGSFGDLHAKKDIVLKGAQANNLYSLQDVRLWVPAKVKDIEALGSVEIHTGTSAENIKAGGKVLVTGINAKAANISTNSNVELWLGGEAKNIYSGGKVEVHTSSKADNIEAVNNVYVGGAGARALNIKSNSNIKVVTFAEADSASAFGSVSKGLTGRIYDNITEHMSSAPVAGDFVNVTEMNERTTQAIDNDTANVKAYVSVFPYKNEANYIFTRNQGMARVYLNKVKNTNNDERFFYENNKQYVQEDGTKSLLNGDGQPFHIGKYQLNGNTYVGAICATATGDFCSSDIIGYLPRIGLVENPSIQGGIGDRLTGLFASWIFEGSYKDYEYVDNSKFIISSISSQSSIENALLAPGAMYFDDDLMLRGHGVSAGTGADGSALVNTFLAEGDIDAALFSPNIYSPYNVKREASESAICNRSLADIDGSTYGSINTVPDTESGKYLRPTNLCKNANAFSYQMNRDPNDSSAIDSVEIDNITVPKLDLGYVALMSEKTIRLMFCTQVFGDVLAKGAIRASTELICGGGERQGVTGSMTSQTGENSHVGSDTNKIHTGSRYEVADPDYSNFDGGQDVPEPQDLYATDEVSVKWARAK